MHLLTISYSDSSKVVKKYNLNDN